MTFMELDNAVLEHAGMARRIARRLSDEVKVETEDMTQVALIGMLEEARSTGKVEKYEMAKAAYRAIRRFKARIGVRRWRENNCHEEFLGDGGSNRPIDILIGREWWSLCTTALSENERQWCSIRFREGLTIEEAVKALGISVFEGRRLEMESVPKCGKNLHLVRRKSEVHPVPSFATVTGAPRNAKAIVEIETGRSWSSLTHLNRETGIKVHEMCRAIRHKGGWFEGKQYRYAYDGEIAKIQEAAPLRDVRLDPRSLGVWNVDTQTYYPSVNAAAAAMAVNQSGLWKSLNKGSGVFHGARFRYATDEENEQRQNGIPRHGEVLIDALEGRL